MRIAVTDFKRPEAPARARFDFDFRDHVLTVLGRWGNRGLAPERPDPLAARCDNEHSPIFPLRHVFARALGFDGEVSDFGRDEKPPGLRDDALKYRREPLAEDMIFFRITGPQHGFIECCGNPMRLSCGFQSIHTGRTGSLFSDGTVVLPHLPNSRRGAVGHHAYHTSTTSNRMVPAARAGPMLIHGWDPPASATRREPWSPDRGAEQAEPALI